MWDVTLWDVDVSCCEDGVSEEWFGDVGGGIWTDLWREEVFEVCGEGWPVSFGEVCVSGVARSF